MKYIPGDIVVCDDNMWAPKEMPNLTWTSGCKYRILAIDYQLQRVVLSSNEASHSLSFTRLELSFRPNKIKIVRNLPDWF